MLFRSRTTSVNLIFSPNSPSPPNAVVASMVTTLPTLCPDLQRVSMIFCAPPRDPMIVAAVSGMLLITNRNTLQRFDVDSSLTEQANEVIYRLPNLCDLSVVIEREISLPSASLPNLIQLKITCDNEDGWPPLFHGATFGKLESVTFVLRSKQIGDFLGAFERAALSSSVQNKLSKLYLFASCSWNPDYSPLLPFTQMVVLSIYSSCRGGCASRVDDDIIISLSRAMPKLETLGLGGEPCHTTAGVTTKGLVALARHCPNLSTLRIHFQVASLSDPPAIPGITPNAESTASWSDCVLRDLEVGRIQVPKESVSIIARTLLRIFPHLGNIWFIHEGWVMVDDAINRRTSPGKQRPLTTPWSILNDHFTGATLETSD